MCTVGHVLAHNVLQSSCIGYFYLFLPSFPPSLPLPSFLPSFLPSLPPSLLPFLPPLPFFNFLYTGTSPTAATGYSRMPQTKSTSTCENSWRIERTNNCHPVLNWVYFSCDSVYIATHMLDIEFLCKCTFSLHSYFVKFALNTERPPHLPRAL